MTAETDLLPLPEYLRADYKRMATDSHEAECKHYARANVAHATAAKDAEIEALREQLAEARDGWHMANGTAEFAMKHRHAAESRAERLAEALRELRNHTSVNSDQIALIDTALAQENDDA